MDDKSAKELNGFGIACVEHIAANTENPAEEELVESQMKAIRKLMKVMNNWFGDFGADEILASEKFFEKLNEQLKVIYAGEIELNQNKIFEKLNPELPDYIQHPERLIRQIKNFTEELVR